MDFIEPEKNCGKICKVRHKVQYGPAMRYGFVLVDELIASGASDGLGGAPRLVPGGDMFFSNICPLHLLTLIVKVCDSFSHHVRNILFWKLMLNGAEKVHKFDSGNCVTVTRLHTATRDTAVRVTRSLQQRRRLLGLGLQ